VLVGVDQELAAEVIRACAPLALVPAPRTERGSLSFFELATDRVMRKGS
jgi:hypothetical protein